MFPVQGYHLVPLELEPINLFFFELGESVDRGEDRREATTLALAELRGEYNATMKGEGAPCRHIINFKVELLDGLTKRLILPIILILVAALIPALWMLAKHFGSGG